MNKFDRYYNMIMEQVTTPEIDEKLSNWSLVPKGQKDSISDPVIRNFYPGILHYVCYGPDKDVYFQACGGWAGKTKDGETVDTATKLKLQKERFDQAVKYAEDEIKAQKSRFEALVGKEAKGLCLHAAPLENDKPDIRTHLDGYDYQMRDVTFCQCKIASVDGDNVTFTFKYTTSSANDLKGGRSLNDEYNKQAGSEITMKVGEVHDDQFAPLFNGSINVPPEELNS